MSSTEMPDHLDEETVQRILQRVLEAEKTRLHMGNPRGVNQEIESIIRDEVE